MPSVLPCSSILFKLYFQFKHNPFYQKLQPQPQSQTSQIPLFPNSFLTHFHIHLPSPFPTPTPFNFTPKNAFIINKASANPMQTLQQENAKLALTIEQFLQEIERQKELNVQHQNQIETLLHFNQRLLLIIENQMNNRRDTCSLQPISERSERSSDLLGTCTLQSLIRSKKMAVKSEWGGATRESLIERKRFKDARITIFDQASEAESLRNQKSESDTETFKPPSENILFRSEVRKGLQELKQFKDKTNTFYTQKMSELKSLSSKITAYHPLNELSKIGQKACVSDQTMSLIRRRVFKSP